MDESTRELVRDWLTRASHELRSARALASLDDPLLDTAICRSADGRAALPRRLLFTLSIRPTFNNKSDRPPMARFLNQDDARQPKEFILYWADRIGFS